MKEKRILDMLGQVDSQYIEEANPLAPNIAKRSWVKWCAMAACFCLIVSGILFGQNIYRVYHTETSYISIDVNPSIELCLNKFDRVINVCAYNDDGQKVVDSLNIKNKPYKEAIEILLKNETFLNYLGDDADLTFTVVSDKEEEIMTGIEQCSSHLKNSREIHCSNQETLHTAHEHNCSVGKYTAYQELAQYDETITIEDCKDMTMHEIHERIKECESGHHDQATEYNNASEEENLHHTEHHDHN